MRFYQDRFGLSFTSTSNFQIQFEKKPLFLKSQGSPNIFPFLADIIFHRDAQGSKLVFTTPNFLALEAMDRKQRSF